MVDVDVVDVVVVDVGLVWVVLVDDDVVELELPPAPPEHASQNVLNFDGSCVSSTLKWKPRLADVSPLPVAAAMSVLTGTTAMT